MQLLCHLSNAKVAKFSISDPPAAAAEWDLSAAESWEVYHSVTV